MAEMRRELDLVAGDAGERDELDPARGDRPEPGIPPYRLGAKRRRQARLDRPRELRDGARSLLDHVAAGRNANETGALSLELALGDRRDEVPLALARQAVDPGRVP